MLLLFLSLIWFRKLAHSTSREEEDYNQAASPPTWPILKRLLSPLDYFPVSKEPTTRMPTWFISKKMKQVTRRSLYVQNAIFPHGDLRSVIHLLSMLDVLKLLHSTSKRCHHWVWAILQSKSTVGRLSPGRLRLCWVNRKPRPAQQSRFPFRQLNCRIPHLWK